MTAAPEMKYMTCKKWKPRMDAISPIVQTSMTTFQYSRQLPPIGHLYHRYGGNQRAAADNSHENDARENTGYHNLYAGPMMLAWGSPPL